MTFHVLSIHVTFKFNFKLNIFFFFRNSISDMNKAFQYAYCYGSETPCITVLRIALLLNMIKLFICTLGSV